MNPQFKSTIDDFISVCKLAGVQIKLGDFEIIFLSAPHKPKSLPKGKIAVYAFLLDRNEEFLKIGIVGPKSNARFLSQHYHHNSSRSNLAKSLLKDDEFSSEVNKENVGNWIKANCCRINILIDKSKGVPLLRLLEAFLHLKFKPRYEQ